MNMLSGSIPWRIKKFGIALICLGVLISIFFWYQNYVSGTIVLDEELLKDIEAKHIESNWEQLLPLGFDVYSDDSYNYNVILTSPKGAQRFDVDLVKIYIHSEQYFTTPPEPNLDAQYHRVRFLDALWGLGSFGECTSRVKFVTPKCTIYMEDYDDSDGKDTRFISALHTLLNAIE